MVMGLMLNLQLDRIQVNPVLGLIGGTGPEGLGLALRFSIAGEKVFLGSRDIKRAEAAAQSVSLLNPSGLVIGGRNLDVAREADIVFVCVPYVSHRDVLMSMTKHLAGKIVIDVAAPVKFRDGLARAVPVDEGSVALQAHAILTDSTVVAAFQTVAAQSLLGSDKRIEADVIVCADDPNAKEIVMKLAEKIKGIRAVNGGGLENACYIENFVALLININLTYSAHSSIKIAGI